MTNLTSKQESFILTMGKGEEFARHGFELLIKRPDPEKYFDAIEKAGFFDPTNNPAPRPSTEPGFVQVPFWTALNYLEAVARRSQELRDLVLSDKVLDVIRTVSNFVDDEGKPTDNYHTFWKFASIIGLLPLEAITLEDLDLVPKWLTSKFDRGLVGHEISVGLMARLLESNKAEDIEKACVLLEHCTELTNSRTKHVGKEFVTVIDDYWLKDLIQQHSKALGTKAGNRSVEIFAARLKQIYSEVKHSYPSTLRRAAIEDSDQNVDSHGADNRFVEGMRDTLLSWLDTNPERARPYVAAMLDSEWEIIRRIALHVVSERFESLAAIFEPRIDPSLFTSAHRHELYALLREHFSQFTAEAKRKSIEAVRSLPEPSDGEDKSIRLKRTQRDWLTAVRASGYEPATIWLQELLSDKTLGPVSHHPEFLWFHEIRRGPGPTPFNSQSLLAYAEDGSLIERLNGFEQADAWDGPTVGGLIDELRSVVAGSPEAFISILSSFHSAKPWFKYALLNGFKSSFDTKTPKVAWEELWPKLLAFITQLIEEPSFWQAPLERESSDRLPTRDWIISLIADLLSAGTKHDDTAYAQSLLPISWRILTSLLSNVSSEISPDTSDPMFQALNTCKGRVIDALVNHSLRVCRLSAKKTQSTHGGWVLVSDQFDAELGKCDDANFEFSTLMGAYMANLDYMSHDWLAENMERIFSTKYPRNFLYAVGGLAFATATRPTYKLLNQHDVFLRALDAADESPIKHERIVEWISLSYLWGDETLETPNFERLFRGEGYLETASSFFWQVRGDKLTDDQKDRILEFWDRCIKWAADQKHVPTKLLSHLSRLSVYVRSIGECEKALLMAVAPHVHARYNFDSFVSELSRLVEDNPAAVGEIILKSLKADSPNYDYQDKLKKLIQSLARLGRKEDAIRCVDALKSYFPAKVELYKSL